MDGGGRIDRDSDLGDDSPMSHIDEHSDREDDMRDCDSSDEGVNVNPNTSMPHQGGIDFSRSPEHHINESHMSQHFGTNHPLNVLGNLTALNMSSLQSLQNLQSLQHNDVLEKLKMQVRDMKVGLMGDQDFPLHSFGGSLTTPANTSFTVPQLAGQPQNLSSQSQNGFPFTTPNIPLTKDGNPGSNSSTSSETSNSSQQNNGWSFEEQYKQVRQLYEINDDPKRKEFLDDLFSFMQKRGTPINRLPIMAKSVLDLYELYNLVIARGGLVDVINKKLWQEIIKGLHLPSSITSAAFTLRTQYMKYLYPYECEKKNLSSPSELQAAIDGNRREGRRSSYGQFDSQLQGQLQMPQVQRSPVPSALQQMSPLSLVTHGNTPAAHHRLMGGAGAGGGPSVGQMSSLVPHEIEQRMMEYIKLFQTPKEPRRNGSQSPEISTRDALNALEMSRVALWSMYNNNTSPPTSINTSPPGTEPQREALNLAESPPPASHIAIKRERIHPDDFNDRDFVQPPPAKRGLTHLNSSIDERDERSSTPTNQMDASSPIKRNDKKIHNGVSNLESKHSIHSNNNNINNNNNNNSNNNNNNHNNNNNNNNNISMNSGMHFNITSRGTASTGDQQLVISIEFNGTLYEGVLFAKPSAASPNSSIHSQNSSPIKAVSVPPTTQTPTTPSSTTNVNSPIERNPHSMVSS